MLSAGCVGTDLEVPHDHVSADSILEVLPDPLAPSYVSAPVVFDLRPLLAELEAAIPRVIGSVAKERRVQLSPDLWAAPELRRGPLRFGFAGNSVSVVTEFDYRIRAWARPLLVEIPLSCGMGPSRPRLRLRLATTYRLDRDWRIRTRTRLQTLEPVSPLERDQCEVSFLRIDVTDRLVAAAADALRGALRELDREVSRVDLAEPMAGLWRQLQEPIGIADSTLWFQIQPHAVSLGPVEAHDTVLVARLTLVASPRLSSGSRPPADPLPLPPLASASGVLDTALVLIEGSLSYEVANRLLRDQLIGSPVGRGWRRVRITDVSAEPAGEGRVLLSVRLRGAANGIVHVVGTPVYDAETDSILVTDLAFDLHTREHLQLATGWLLRGRLLDAIGRQARLPASSLLGEAVALTNREINREISPGVRLRGRLSEARTLRVAALASGLFARARGSGRLWLEISPVQLVPDDALKRASPLRVP